MRYWFLLLLILRCSLCAIEVDFDYVFVGTSPISVLESLYRSYSGFRVLLLEAAPTMGGAWKTIDICGVHNVDMGCHQIGSDEKFKKFMEKYVGCQFVPMNNPYGQRQLLQSADRGLYFSEGCHELMHHLYLLVQASDAVLLLNHKLESVYLDFDRSIAQIKTNGKSYTVSKLVVTPCTSIEIENFPHLPKPVLSKHYHLYLLVKDDTPVRFTYYNGFCKGMSRTINLTPFSSELQGTGQQLIAIQTNDLKSIDNPAFFLEELKKKQLIDPSAHLISSEIYIYEQAHLNQAVLQGSHPKTWSFFEVLRTDAIWNIPHHTDKWEKVFKPFSLVVQK